ncbi:hypothetical protein JCM9279_007607 [Rhodotorula babjevae]
MSTTTAATTPSAESPAEPAAAPTSPPLPDELWLKILNELDYAGLQKAEQLCKKFKGFLQDTSLDNALFRAKPPQELVPGMKVTIHPLLQATNCLFYGKDAVTKATWMTGVPERTAFKYSAIDEYATNPSCRRMYLRVGCEAPAKVKDANGITVGRLLRSLGRFWGSEPPREIALDYLGGNMELEDVTWRTTIGRHMVWTCWRKAFVKVHEEKGPSIVLVAEEIIC